MEDIKLYSHNQETYDKIQALWKTENKVAAVQATGTGKSYLILKCVYNAPEANKVILAPSNYILEQIEKEAREVLPNTILLTYSKLSFMSDTEIESLNIDYIFLDEFHRCGAEQWGDGVQRLLNAFPDAKVLGTSATHIRFLDNARNMGEELFNGNIVNNLSLAEAIVKKILPMPVYISALYTYEDEVNNLKTKVENSKNDEESKKELLKEIELMKHKLNKSKGIPNILKKHLSKNYNGKFIIFCKDKIHLDEMKETVVDWFKQSKVTKQVDVYSVYSNYEYGDAEVEAFIGNKNPKSVKLLFSIEMFNEGIHIEDVTGVILLRPTVSPIIYYQQIGRVMQAGKNNTPVIFDLVNNFDNIGAKNFVEDLEKEAKLENDKLGKDDDKGDGEEKKYVDISEFMIFDETLETMDLFAKIEEGLFDDWDIRYKQLKEYYIENGHLNILRKDKNNFKLYLWAGNQRTNYKKGKLCFDRVEKLNHLSFDFNDMIDIKWENMYLKIKNYKLTHPNYQVLYDNIKDDKTLEVWARNQKDLYVKGILEKEKIEKLNEIGFIWNYLDFKWDAMYTLLKRYKEEFGDFKMPNTLIYKDEKLGSWVKSQRKYYDKNMLSQDRLLRLKKIGFSFSPHDDKWNFMFSILKKYSVQFGNCLLPYNYIYLNEKLGMWVKCQRRDYKNNRLSEERIQKLNDIGFVWIISTDYNLSQLSNPTPMRLSKP